MGEILSLADGSIYSGDTINLDTISVNSMLHQQGVCEVKEEPQEVTHSHNLRESLRHPMGSLTSVNTVKEMFPSNTLHSHTNTSHHTSLTCIQPPEEPSSTTPLPMDITETDIGQIYDDVMQCVYDDVDVKYDDLALRDTGDTGEAPVPPPRIRSGSVTASVDQGLDKPLPGVPRNKIISKLEEKKNELREQREREAEKKKQLEEQKRKEREALEEQKRLEREEREKKKMEEKEKKRLEEEQKKAQKKREEDEKKAKKLAEMEDEAKLKQSLFQRLFQRSQSRTEGQTEQEEADSTVGGDPVPHSLSLEVPPPVPPHATTPQLNELEGQLGDLEQLMQGSMGPGDLQRLDSLVTEFTNQFPPEPSESTVRS